jgi:hypothetical protein
MSQLNCKLGDLAIVVNTIRPENLGQIVKVIGVPVPAPNNISGRGHVWQVRTVSGRSGLRYRYDRDGGRIERHSGGRHLTAASGRFLACAMNRLRQWPRPGTSGYLAAWPSPSPGPTKPWANARPDRLDRRS